MDLLNVWLHELADVGLQLLQSPYFYGALLLAALVSRRLIQLQRKLFFARFHSFLGTWWGTVISGLFVGLLASAILLVAGATMQVALLPIIWLVALVLMLFRLRFGCFSYVIGVVALFAAILQQLPAETIEQVQHASIDWLLAPLLAADFYSLFLLVGVLHLFEALLVRIQGQRAPTPLYVMGKRGKLIGAYLFKRMWPVPLLMVAPLASDASLYTVWSDPKQLGQWLVLLPLPVIIGYFDVTWTKFPATKLRAAANGLFLYGLLVIGLAVAVSFLPIVALPATVLLLLGHELVRLWSLRKEQAEMPLFVNHAHGLKVLAVLPNSPAERVGIVAGEVIHKVNDCRVQTRRDLFEAVQLRPAYCKLEVFNLEGNLKFLKKAMFADDHHQLGLLLAPDDEVQSYAELRDYSLLSYLRIKVAGVGKRISER